MNKIKNLKTDQLAELALLTYHEGRLDDSRLIDMIIENRIQDYISSFGKWNDGIIEKAGRHLEGKFRSQSDPTPNEIGWFEISRGILQYCELDYKDDICFATADNFDMLCCDLADGLPKEGFINRFSFDEFWKKTIIKG